MNKSETRMQIATTAQVILYNLVQIGPQKQIHRARNKTDHFSLAVRVYTSPISPFASSA